MSAAPQHKTTANASGGAPNLKNGAVRPGAARPATAGAAASAQGRSPGTVIPTAGASSGANSESAKRKAVDADSEHENEITTEGAKRAKVGTSNSSSSSSDAAAATSSRDEKTDNAELVPISSGRAVGLLASASPWVDLNIRFTNPYSKEKLYWLRCKVPPFGSSEPMDITFKKIAAKGNGCARMMIIDARNQSEFEHTTPFMLLGAATKGYPYGNVIHSAEQQKGRDEKKNYDSETFSSGQLSFQFTVMPYEKHGMNPETGASVVAEKYREWVNRVFDHWLWASISEEGTRPYLLWRVYCGHAKVNPSDPVASRAAFLSFAEQQSPLFKKTVQENGVPKNSNDGKAMYVTDYMTTMRRDDAAIPEPDSPVWYIQTWSKTMAKFEAANKGFYLKMLSLVDAHMKVVPYFQRFTFQNGDLQTTIGAGCVISARIKLVPDMNDKPSKNPVSLKPLWVHGVLARQGVKQVVEEETSVVAGGEPFRHEVSVSAITSGAESTAVVPVDYAPAFGADVFSNKKAVARK